MIDRYMVIVLTATIICCGTVGCMNNVMEKYKHQEMIYFNGR